jgi:hypothetical protein
MKDLALPDQHNSGFCQKIRPHSKVNGTDFLEIAMTGMIYVDKNWSRKMQQYSATVVRSNFWDGLKGRQTDRQTECLIDGETERETGKNIDR